MYHLYSPHKHHVTVNYRIWTERHLLMCLCAPASYNLLTHLSKITELNVYAIKHINFGFVRFTGISSVFVRVTEHFTIQTLALSIYMCVVAEVETGFRLQSIVDSTLEHTFKCIQHSHTHDSCRFTTAAAFDIIHRCDEAASSSKVHIAIIFGNTSKFYAFPSRFNTDVVERDIPMNIVCLCLKCGKMLNMI